MADEAQEPLPSTGLTKQEIAERITRDVARSLKWRAICEEAAEPQTESEGKDENVDTETIAR